GLHPCGGPCVIRLFLKRGLLRPLRGLMHRPFGSTGWPVATLLRRSAAEKLKVSHYRAYQAHGSITLFQSSLRKERHERESTLTSEFSLRSRRTCRDPRVAKRVRSRGAFRASESPTDRCA